MDALPGTQLTDMWMANPWMFDPTQLSNRFSNFNNARLPQTQAAGVPINAATGQPIQSFLDWQQANPGGMTVNNTPAAPAQAPTPSQWAINNAMLNSQGRGLGAGGGGPSPQIGDIIAARGMNNAAYGMTGSPYADPRLSGLTPTGGGAGGGGAGPTGTPSATPQGAPNNWQAYLQALANPGKVTTPGAQVPQGGAGGWGFQPAGGVNQAFLNQRGYGPGGAPQGGLNPNFMSALAAIQGRPQQ